MSSTLLTVINVSIPCIISSGWVYCTDIHGIDYMEQVACCWLLTVHYILYHACSHALSSKYGLGWDIYTTAWCIHRCMVFYNNNAMVCVCMRMYTHTVLCYLMMFRLEELGMGHFKRLVNSQHTGKMQKVHADVHTHKHPLQATPNISS